LPIGRIKRYDSPVRFVLVVVLVLVIAMVRASDADVYSWTDDEGVAHFTNIKPSGGKWRRVLSSEPDRGSKAAARRGTCERCDKVPSTDNTAERFHRYDQFIQEASDLYRIPVPLIRAVIKVESDYDPKVISSMDCKDLMQVHPQVEIDISATGDIFDPRTNIMTGTRLLRWLANRVDGDLVLTIAGYHAGLGSLAKYGYTVPPFKHTQQYLKMVLERYYQYKAEAGRPK